MKNFKLWLFKKWLRFLFELEWKAIHLRCHFDKCHVCGEEADCWCEGCDLRHCYDHESGLYSDVNFCTDCRGDMTDEEIAAMEQEEIEDTDSIDPVQL